MQLAGHHLAVYFFLVFLPFFMFIFPCFWGIKSCHFGLKNKESLWFWGFPCFFRLALSSPPTFWKKSLFFFGAKNKEKAKKQGMEGQGGE